MALISGMNKSRVAVDSGKAMTIVMLVVARVSASTRDRMHTILTSLSEGAGDPAKFRRT